MENNLYLNLYGLEFPFFNFRFRIHILLDNSLKLVERAFSYKIALLGDPSVGKTSIRRNYMGKVFETNYVNTIGADFAIKRIETDEGDSFIIQIWDLSGQVGFKQVRKTYYPNCSGIILVYSLIDDQSLQNIPSWLSEYISGTGRYPIPIVIVGNKVDLVNVEEIPAIYDTHRAELERQIKVPFDFFLTSALTGENVEKSFLYIINQLSYTQL